MSHTYIELKKEEGDSGDLMINLVNIYGDEMDFFFLTASMTGINDPSLKKNAKKEMSLVRLKPEKI